MRQALITTLTKSLLPSTLAATESLTQFSLLSQQQLLPDLISITLDSSLHPTLQLAALTQLKLAIQHRWRPNSLFKTKQTTYLTDNQKQFLKQNIFAFFLKCQSQPEFSKLLRYIVSTVVRLEHKEWMPTEELVGSLGTMEMSVGNVEVALEFVLCVAQAFEKVGKSEVYSGFCERIMPGFDKYVRGEEGSGKIVYLLSKVYWCSANSHLNKYFQENNEMWMNFIQLVLDSYNEEFYRVEKIVKGSNEFYYFHSKKWITRSIMKLIISEPHATKTNVFGKLSTTFLKNFITTHLPFFIPSILKSLSLPNPCTPKLQYFQLRTLFHSLKSSPNLLTPYKPQLQSSFLPFFIASPKSDYFLITDSPLQYLHKQQDDCWGFTNVRMASIYLWVKLVTSESLQGDLEWVCGKVKSSEIGEVEMGMGLLAGLAELERGEVEEAVGRVVEFLVEKIGEGKVGEMLIKYRFLELVIRYPKIKLNQELLKGILEIVVPPLLPSPTQSSPNQLIIIKSLQSLNTLISHHPATFHLIQPHINPLLQFLLTFLSLPDSQDLVPSFYQLIKNLKYNLTTYLNELITYFVNQFLRFSQQFNDIQTNSQRYDGKVEDAAVGCISIVESLMDVMTDEQLRLCEGDVVRMVEECFTENGVEYYGDGLRLLNIYVFQMRGLSQGLLFFYPCVLYKIIGIPESFDFSAMYSLPPYVPRQLSILESIRSSSHPENIQKSFPLLRNYIYRHPSLLSPLPDFFNNPSSSLLLELIKIIQTKSKPSNSFDCIELLSMWSLIVFVFENSENRELNVQMIKLLFGKSGGVDKEKESYQYLRRMWSVLWCMCAYREPEMMVRLIDLEGIEGSMKGMDSYQKKRIIIGLTSILDNQPAINYCKENGISVLKIIKIASDAMSEGTIFDDLDDQQDLDFSERLDEHYHSNLMKVDELKQFQRVVIALVTKYPEAQGEIMKVLKGNSYMFTTSRK